MWGGGSTEGGPGNGVIDNTVIDVESLPTENIDNDKIYRMEESISGTQLYIAEASNFINVADMLSADGGSVSYIVVDELPESLIVSDFNTMNITIYIIRSTGVAYIVPELDAEPIDFGLILGGLPSQGIITSTDEITQTGYYVILGDDWVLVSYGIPDVDSTRDIYEYTNDDGWINTSEAVKTVKEYEPIVTFVKNAGITSYNRVVKLDYVSNDKDITHMCIPSFIDTVNVNLYNSLTNIECAEDNDGYYWTDEDGKNRVLVNSKIDASVDTIDIPEPIKIVGPTFENFKNLTNINFNYQIKSIAGAFTGCTALESVTLPTNLVILDKAFWNCPSLKNIIFPAGLRQMLNNPFGSSDNIESISTDYQYSNSSVYVETGCLISRESKTLLFGIKNSEIPNDIRYIAEYAFYYRFNYENLTLPDSLLEIGECAFRECKTISNIVIPINTMSIGNEAFYGCSGLTSVTFKSVGIPTFISNRAFAGCSNLTDIYVPWAEGAVANAPWGATKATIHYNHVAEA